MHWRREWQPTPVFLPGESQGRGSLVGCRLWGRTELDTTEATKQQQQQQQYELLSPKDSQEGEENVLPGRHQSAVTPYSEPQGSPGRKKHRILAPERRGA